MHLIYKTFKVILSILLISLSTSIYAQKNRLEPARLSAGIRGGYYSTSMTFYPAINSVPMLTPTFGVVMKYHAEKYFGAQIEVNYASTGWTELNRYDVEQEIYQRQFDYLQIPFLTHIYVGKKNLQVFITLGPQLDILLQESKNIITDINDQTYDYYDKPASPYVISLAGGVGINLITKIGHFQVEGRFSAGMTEALENENRSSTDRGAPVVGGINFSYLIPIRGWKEKPKNASGEGDAPIEQPSESGWEQRD